VSSVVIGLRLLTTLPLRRQDVQTRMRLVGRADFGVHGGQVTFQRRLLTLCAWLIVLPLIASCRKSDNCANRTALQNLVELGVKNVDCTGFERV